MKTPQIIIILLSLTSFSETAICRPSPKMTSNLSQNIKDSKKQLKRALEQLNSKKTTLSEILTAEAALDSLRRWVSTYFHGEGQAHANMREAYLMARIEIKQLQSGHQPVLVIRRGVVHFNAEIHQTLAHAYEVLGRQRDKRRHLQALSASRTSTIQDLTPRKVMPTQLRPSDLELSPNSGH